ncbi:MAG: SprB repeat-containing protein, partial [Bacteroidia bacterium]|nr:SprB repeat-containing protein [Bacteroidia bacterium]
DSLSQTTLSASGLNNGSYTVTVTDNNGCSQINIATIINIPAGTITISTYSNPSCYGYCDGSATISVAGVAFPYTILWSDNQTTSTASGLCAGNYSVVVTDANNCIINTSVNLIDPPVLSSTIIISDVIGCAGNCDGSLTAIPSGGTSPYTYLWNDPNLQTTSTASNLCAGTIFVTVTDVNGCTITADTILYDPVSLTIDTSYQNAHCGFSDGAIYITVGSGSPPYTFLWNTGDTTQNLINIIANLYCVTVTDYKNCTADICIEVINVPGPNVYIDSSTNVSCYGSCDGFASLAISGGVPPYTYVWSPGGQSGAIATNLCQGLHSVQVTDYDGCTDNASILITQPAQLAINVITNDPSCVGSCNGTIEVDIVTGGTAPYYYEWSGQTGTTSLISGLCEGDYTVTVSDNNGCEISQTVTLNDPPVFSATTSQTDVSCYGTCDGTATVNAVGGTLPYSYLWNDPLFQNTQTAIFLCSGSYAVIVSDANGCTEIKYVAIDSPEPFIFDSINIIDVTCNGSCNGVIQTFMTGGSPPYYFDWDTGDSTQDVSDLCSGIHFITAQDYNGCQIDTALFVWQPTALSITLTPIDESCYNSDNGSVQAIVTGGTPMYSYLWDGNTGFQTSQNAINLSPGTYTLTVTDANNCIANSSATVNGPSQLAINIVSTTPANCGQSNGSAIISISGGISPYSYLWVNNAGSTVSIIAAITNVPSGSYYVTITDVIGCTADEVVNINDIDGPSISGFDINDATCYGNSDGSATVNVTGGVSPYSYQWNDTLQQVTANAIGLAQGNYSVMVTDAAGCMVNGDVDINEPAQLVAAVVNTTPVTCSGNCNGTATVQAAGGTTPYLYFWDNTQTTPIATGLCQGYHPVTITDQNGCSKIVTAIISQPNPLIITYSQVAPITCYGLHNGMISVIVAGGMPGYTYLWLPNGGNSPTTGQLYPDDYFVLVTDNQGCTLLSPTYTITEPAPIAATLGTIDATCLTYNGQVYIDTISGGTPGYGFIWSPCIGNCYSETMENLAPGYYQLQVEDANGCEAIFSTTIVSVPPPEYLTITTSPTRCYGGDDGTAMVNVGGGVIPFTYIWSAVGQGNATIDSLSAGTYQVTVIDGNNCQITNS